MASELKGTNMNMVIVGDERSVCDRGSAGMKDTKIESQCLVSTRKSYGSLMKMPQPSPD